MRGPLKVEGHRRIEGQLLVLRAVLCAQKPERAVLLHLTDVHRSGGTRAAHRGMGTEETVGGSIDDLSDLLDGVVCLEILMVLFRLVLVDGVHWRSFPGMLGPT